jgi:hypothetical protein
MARYKISWKASTRQIAIHDYSVSAPSGYTNLGNFYHDQNEDTLGNNPEVDHAENHVFWHHVRDALYAGGIQDMSTITIKIFPTSVLVSPDPWGTFEVGDTRQAYVAFTPANTTSKAGTWSSSVPAKATVDPVTGLVTAVNAGATNISFTSTDGAKTDLVAVTVTAP